MKRNLAYFLSLLILYWVLLTFFSFIIAIIISQVSEIKGLVSRILDLTIGIIIFGFWLLIWYLIIKRSFYKKITKYMK
jgi:glucan phosphoethanolaminetransferase (alkaline phosphatase superfamily)